MAITTATNPRGAGRKPGTQNRMSSQVYQRALAISAQTGQPLPHEFMWYVMLGNPIFTAAVGKDGQVLAKGGKWEIPTIEQRLDMAKAAAPYYAPRLSAIEVTKNASDSELEAVIAEFAKEAGIDLFAGGTSPPPQLAAPNGTAVIVQPAAVNKRKSILPSSQRKPPVP